MGVRARDSADKVDTPVQFGEPPGGKPRRNLVARHPLRYELCARHYAVLTPGECMDHAINKVSARLSRHIRFNPAPNDLAPPH
jgi:hypothetical protein